MTPTMPPLHIVCFAPYTNWSIHSARQVTILQALRLRGCSVSCDGAFEVCDMTQAANGAAIPPDERACLTCQSSVAARLAAWGMPYRWFGRWLKSPDFALAQDWAAHLDPQTFATAVYDGPADGKPARERWEIGHWVRSSVHTHLRHNVLDLHDPAVVAAYRHYLKAGLLAALGLSRLFARERPAAQLLFNGRMSVTRVALEVAKQRGIRSLVEERATTPGRLSLFEDATCLELTAFDALWETWRGLALNAEEIAEVGDYLDSRWRGRSTDVSVFSRAADDAQAMYRHLGLDPAKPLWALYTSSLDESIDEPRAVGAFPSQGAWIEATIAEAARRPHVQLAIRVHPNSGSKKSLGRNPQDAAFFARIATTLPANVRLIGGDDDTSSYTLAAAADLGFVWYSTIGLEMAAIGKPVLRAGASWLAHCDAFVPVSAPADFASAIDRTLSEAPGTGECRTAQAWRFMHCWTFRQTIPFALVKQPQWFIGEPAYTGLDALAPGRDANLDRICGVVMERVALHPPPPLRGADMAAAEAQAIAGRIVAYRAEAA